MEFMNILSASDWEKLSMATAALRESKPPSAGPEDCDLTPWRTAWVHADLNLHILFPRLWHKQYTVWSFVYRIQILFLPESWEEI